ncbi:SAV_915 family protein, partial [Nonomuraea sp. PA05]|uniref:SAV_915 family protein n=1 Tax=Nonomuraea sp. PA05 TaxID=2604466 RepID=UPI001CA3107E
AAGKRAAVAFTSRLKLTRALGPDHQWAVLTEPALRGMLAELDVAGIVIGSAGTMSRPARRVA